MGKSKRVINNYRLGCASDGVLFIYHVKKPRITFTIEAFMHLITQGLIK